MESIVGAESTTDLTDRQFWDRHWDDARSRSLRVKNKVRELLNLGPGPLYSFLAGVIDSACDEPSDVIELGCAPGSILSLVQSLSPKNRYHGVDFSADGIRDAHRRFAQLGAEATLHQADLRDFNPDRRYGFVFSCGLIEHFEDPSDILSHHTRLCQPGGRVVVTVPNFRGWLQVPAIRALDPETLSTHNLEIMKIDTLRELLIKAGLSQVESGSFGRGVIRPERTQAGLKAKAIQIGALAVNEAMRFVPMPASGRHYLWASGTVS